LPDVALSDFEVATALSLLAATTGDGPANHTKNPVASIKAARPLALTIIWQSPHSPAPDGEMRPRRVSTARQKKGIFGQDRAKAGQLSWNGRVSGAGASQAGGCEDARSMI
jgi:hypothetical protein